MNNCSVQSVDLQCSQLIKRPQNHKIKTKKRPLFHGKKDQKKTTFERKKDQTAESIPVKITLICMKHAYGNLLGIHCLNIDHHLPTLEIQLLSHWYTKSQGLNLIFRCHFSYLEREATWGEISVGRDYT